MIRLLPCFPLCLSLTSEEELKGYYDNNEETCRVCTTRNKTTLKVVIEKFILNVRHIPSWFHH